MTVMFQLPADLGGGTVPGIRDGNFVKLDLPVLGGIIVAAHLVTELAPPPPALPAEPPVGTIVFDPDGDLWHHKEQGKWFFGAACCTWDEWVARFGEPTAVASTGPAETYTAVERYDLAAELPVEIPTVLPGRAVAVTVGRNGDQLIVQVNQDNLFGRAGILDADAAERVGWTLIKAAADLKSGALW